MAPINLAVSDMTCKQIETIFKKLFCSITKYRKKIYNGQRSSPLCTSLTWKHHQYQYVIQNFFKFVVFSFWVFLIVVVLGFSVGWWGVFLFRFWFFVSGLLFLSCAFLIWFFCWFVFVWLQSCFVWVLFWFFTELRRWIYKSCSFYYERLKKVFFIFLFCSVCARDFPFRGSLDLSMYQLN